MFQNDISFITKDIYREDILNLPEIIKESMEDHLKNSIATPFCFLWEQLSVSIASSTSL